MALADARRPVVLAVDDDRGIRDVLAGTLEGHYDIVMAADGEAAIQAFEEQRFDAVLLDIRMPGLGGIDVLRRMKTIEPRVEIILLTAVEEVPTVVEGMKAGAFDYITKPWGIDDLLARLANAVRRREGEEVLLVAGDIGLFTALHVVVERSVANAVSVSPETALKGYAGGRPRLVIVEVPADPEAAVDLVGRLRTRYQDSPLLVAAPDVATADRVREAAGLQSWAVLAGPLHLGNLLEWLGTAMTPLGQAHVSLPSLRPAVVQGVDHVIRHHGERLLSEDVARAAGISARQLADTFNDCLGMSAKEFITRFRVASASRMLIDGAHTLQQIADATGFEDASHLSHVFNRYLGVRPGEYRRRLKAAGA